MKNILGLDLGTNSIGWAVVSTNENDTPQKIECMGSRIIPMDAEEMGKFNSGNTISKTANRTAFRGVRRLKERSLLRRERLHRVLNILGFLPEHYAQEIGWNKNEPKTFGKFIENQEPKLAWRPENDHFQFIFMDSFYQMLEEFRQINLNFIQNGRKIPLDWTIYFLRKKALTEKISKEELAWIILNFNQKRGYYQLRGEDDEDGTKTAKTKKVFYTNKINKITDTGKEYKGLKILFVELENGSVGKIFKREIPQWVGLEKNIISTIDIDSEGNEKKDEFGNISQRFAIPTDAEWESEWQLIKLKTQKDLDQSHKTVGTYIYDSLLNNPTQKIRGKLVRTIERKYYREEFEAILTKQSEFHPELKDKKLYKKCISELYPSNENQKNNIQSWSFVDLFIKDILFYQRPLKSKKSLISNCPFESRYSPKGDHFGVKCIAKSHPLFQEFRLWKFIANLKIFEREKEINGKYYTDYEVTSEFLQSEDDYVALFDWLNDKEKITQDSLFGSYFKIKKVKGKEYSYPYRWNYVDDKTKEYPCNETRGKILSKLEKAEIDKSFLTSEKEEQLWHILYSVEDKVELETALNRFAEKNRLNSDFIDSFKKIRSFEKEYGSFSAKAIKKMLPLMRMGKYWSIDAIDSKTIERIEKIIDAEDDENIQIHIREKLKKLQSIYDYKGLQEHLACYIVYNRFSEAKEVTKWETPKELDDFIINFKQNSLRNPIVEQIILETLRTVRDIWIKEGHIDEIHLELGRELRNDKKERERLSKVVSENENTNLRIKAMLMEFKNPNFHIDGVIPHSPTQQEILKIYEEFAVGNLTKEDSEYEFINKISKNANLTSSEILRYKLWLEQKYKSPYTGLIIPLGKLFTEAYQIEHVIPQSRFFDDSFSNKVICESEVNALKDRELGYEFIKNHHGEKVLLTSSNIIIDIVSEDKYIDFVKSQYSYNRSKMKKMLMEDIPDQFIERQLNDTKYISKEIKRLLSNIVRQKLEDGSLEQEATSKNLISVTGSITSQLKQHWGINDKWNELVLPRFERLNEMTGTLDYIAINKEGHKIPKVPFLISKGFSTKRIDHRHHAMDAVVIACTTREHVQYLNNENAKSQKFHLQKGLAKKLRRFEEIEIPLKEKNENGVWTQGKNFKKIEVPKDFYKPWDSFPVDVKNELDKIIVSFKQNLRVIYKTKNLTQKMDESGKKKLVEQTKGEHWSIRKPLHKDTVFGEVNLRKIKEVSLPIAIMNPTSIVNIDLKKKIMELINSGNDLKKIKKYFEENKEIWSDINLSKISIYYFTKNDTNDKYFATRKELGSIFKNNKGTFLEIEKIFKNILKITDTGIQKILLRFLETKDNNPEIAFSPEGIEELNLNIKKYNNGKDHQPILKVRVYEKAEKFSVGQTGNKKEKFVEAADGTNLFFAIYLKKCFDQNENCNKRIFRTIPLREIICRIKIGEKAVPSVDKDGNPLFFILSPYDLVYIPRKNEEQANLNHIERDRIFRVNDFSEGTIYFTPVSFSKEITEKEIDTSFNSKTAKFNGEQIKEICIPLKIDRLGRIISIFKTDD
ncbi:MAG: csn1 [Bacteroidetes bacterium]|nr:csn1 [Bacteroidota bacterium]